MATTIRRCDGPSALPIAIVVWLAPTLRIAVSVTKIVTVSRRELWPAVVIVVTMIGPSMFFRSQLHAADYGEPLQHEAECGVAARGCFFSLTSYRV